ncbi:hypothetical protein ACFSQT_27825 [Mesorhizobium calcicola]|uniref:Uncharacterized protein n=1 Tax=Mesorhizobium calcicola TaxID=1300310 RepID=A0ABW4WJK6_9HYPH
MPTPWEAGKKSAFLLNCRKSEQFFFVHGIVNDRIFLLIADLAITVMRQPSPGRGCGRMAVRRGGGRKDF